MAAPTFVSAGTVGAEAFGTSVTPGLPGSRSNGNILIAIVTSQAISAHAFTFPGGWSVIDSVNNANGSSALAYRYVDGSETAPTITWTGNDSANSVVLQFTGVIGTNPIGQTHKTGPTAVQSTSGDTGISVERNNSTVLAVTTGDSGVQAVVTPAGGSYTQRFIATSGNSEILVYDNPSFAAVSDATGSWSVTWTNTRKWTGYTIELASEALVTEIDIPTSGTLDPALGVSQATILTAEQSVTLAASLGISQATTLDREIDLVVSASLGISEAAEVDFGGHIHANIAMGVSEVPGLEAIKSLSVAPMLGADLAASLSLSGNLIIDIHVGFSESIGRRKRQPVICVST